MDSRSQITDGPMATVDGVAVSDNTSVGQMTDCRSELLCFLQQKADLIPFDQLVKIVCDFFRSEEILTA